MPENPKPQQTDPDLLVPQTLSRSSGGAPGAPDALPRISALTFASVDEPEAEFIERMEADFVNRIKAAGKFNAIAAAPQSAAIGAPKEFKGASNEVPSAATLAGVSAQLPAQPGSVQLPKRDVLPAVANRPNTRWAVSVFLGVLALAGWALWAYNWHSSGARDSKVEARLERSQAAEQLQSQREQPAHLAGDLPNANAQLSATLAEVAGLKQTQDELNGQIEGARAELSSLRQQIAAAPTPEEVAGLKQTRDELNGQIERARAELSSLQQQIAADDSVETGALALPGDQQSGGGDQALARERERASTLARDLAASRDAVENLKRRAAASQGLVEKQEQALARERERARVLARDLAALRQELESERARPTESARTKKKAENIRRAPVRSPRNTPMPDLEDFDEFPPELLPRQHPGSRPNGAR